MAFSSNDGDDVLSEINITPLVDVMLVLLVAFIVTIPVLNQSVDLNLPKTAAAPPPKEQKALTVSIDRDSRIFIDKRELAPGTLQQELSALRKDDQELSLHLKADEAVPYGPVAKALVDIERAGITRVSVLTAPE